MNLKKKMILSICFCLMITYSTFYFITVSTVTKQNTLSSFEQTTTLINSKQEQIDLWFNGIINEFKILSHLPQFKSMDIRNVNDIVTSLDNDLIDNNYIDFITYGWIDGKSWINSRNILEYMPRELFLSMLENNSEYYISRSSELYNNEDYIFLFYPITNYANQTKTVICGGILTSQINKLLSEIDVYGSKASIIDKQGNLIAGSQLLLDNHIIDDFNNFDSGIVEEDESTIFYSSFESNTEWVLCTKIKNDSIFNQTNLIIRDLSFAFLAILVISIVFANFIAEAITKPISNLTETMKTVDYHHLKPLNYSNKNDEISQLTNAYNDMILKIDDLFKEIVRQENEKNEVELKVLQSQINPHFLYNTLATIKWMTYKYNAVDLAEIVDHLSSFFRVGLSEGESIIPLEKEIEHTTNYLYIQNIRYKNKLTYSIQCDDTIKMEYVVKLIIQPLVENAIYHGIKQIKGLGHISIKCLDKADYIQITVTDNGCGMCKEKLNDIKLNLAQNIASKNFGLHNIYTRLKLSYCENFSFDISSEITKGTTVLITLPKQHLSINKEDNYD